MDITITMEGTAPLLMHNSRLANPLDPTAKALKAISGKRKKTDDDYGTMARLDHFGGLYLDPDIGPYIPGENIARCLVDGARITKAGKNVERALFVSSDVNPLSYQGPRTADTLWADENFRHTAIVRIGIKRLMRCRPIFRQWKTQATAILDTTVISLEELQAITEQAGIMVGLGDWRPRYGRFVGMVQRA